MTTPEEVEQARQVCRALILIRHADEAEVDRVMGLMEFECTFGKECWLEHYGAEPDAEYAGYLLRDFKSVQDGWAPDTTAPAPDTIQDVQLFP